MGELAVLRAEVVAPDEPVVVQVVGDVDAANVAVLTDALLEAFASSEGPVVVDCARWTFVDAAGLRALSWFGDEAARRNRLAVLRNMSTWLHRLVRISGVDQHFQLGMAGHGSPA